MAAALASFDQRPGDLEATRGAIDPRAAFMVWGERGPDGWHVRVNGHGATEIWLRRREHS